MNRVLISLPTRDGGSGESMLLGMSDRMTPSHFKFSWMPMRSGAWRRQDSS
jgi:hypothetical protein